MTFFKDLIQTNNKQTVFSLNDLAKLLPNYTGEKLQQALKYAIKQTDMIRISEGIYAINKNYSKWEFANKFRKPSYISLYTILQREGVVFQPYEKIYAITNRSEEVEIDNQTYVYRKIKNEILLNPLGTLNKDNIQQATIERAICDKLYLDGDEYFDNLNRINWELIEKINKEVFLKNSTITNFIKKNKK